MNKRGSDGRGSCKVYGMANTVKVTNMVVTVSGNGGDLFEKRQSEVKYKTEIFNRRSW